MRKVIGIIGAMDSETSILSEQIQNKIITEIAGTKYFSGKLKGINVVVVTCGIGKVNAACITQAMICVFSVTHIINTGIAGGIKSFLRNCDIVLSENVVYHDMIMPEGPFIDEVKADFQLLDIAEEASKKISVQKNVNYYKGRIASGDQFVSDQNLKEQIINICDPLCVEMEGAAIGHCAKLNNIPFVIVRCISDDADDNAKMTFYEFKQQTCEISSYIVLEILKLI